MRLSRLSFMLLTLMGNSAPAIAHGSAGKPNIIFILGDDIGYGDFGCYGATKIKTPHVDRMARQGVRFTDAHSPSAMCTPTRYAFMTGRYAWRQPGGASVLSGLAPLCIAPGSPTVPSLLKRAGYATARRRQMAPGSGRATDRLQPPDQAGTARGRLRLRVHLARDRRPRAVRLRRGPRRRRLRPGRPDPGGLPASREAPPSRSSRESRASAR